MESPENPGRFSLRFAVELHKLCEIDIRTESAFNCHQVCFKSVCCQLDATGETVLNIVHEHRGIFGVSSTCQP